MTNTKPSHLPILILSAALLMLPACRQTDRMQTPEEQELVFSALIQDEAGLRAGDTSWDPADRIGILSARSGAGGTTSFVQSNVPYTTTAGDGRFTPAGSERITPLSDTALDLIAYYPYQSTLKGTSVVLDLTDQSDPAAIDLLYSDNAKEITPAHRQVTLRFSHRLSKLVLQVTAEDPSSDLSTTTATIGEVVTTADFDLATAHATPTGTAKTIAMHRAAASKTSATLSVLLLPDQPLAGTTITIAVGGEQYTWTLPAEAPRTESGKRYTYPIRLGTKDGTETPTPPSALRAAYMEMPVYNGGVLSSDETQVIHMAPDTWFAGGTTALGQRRNYSLLYSVEHRQPLWIAYPMYRDCLGSSGRTDAWGYDPDVRRDLQPTLKKGYSGSYSRGHMLASNNRTASRALNETTFYYTNMVPQNQQQNSGPWNVLENKENSLAKNTQPGDTIYVVCGPMFEGTTATVKDNDGKAVTVPSHTWKVMLRRDPDGSYHSIGVKMPNESSAPAWTNCVVPVSQLERELNMRFFTHLPDNVAEQVKNQTSTAGW